MSARRQVPSASGSVPWSAVAAAIAACGAQPASLSGRRQAVAAEELDVRVSLTSEADIKQRRQEMIRFFWGEAGLPKSLPTQVKENITGLQWCVGFDCKPDPDTYVCTAFPCSTEGAVTDVQSPTSPSRFGPLPNLARVDELVIQMDAGERSVAHHLIAKNSNNRLVILHGGHGCTFRIDDGMLPTIGALLAHGYSVLATYMPHYQPDLCDASLHDVFFAKTKVSQGHGHVAKFFLEPIVVSINYLKTRSAADGFPDYVSYDMVGLSGGGWSTVMYAALDPTIERSVSVSGSIPFHMRKCSGSPDLEYTCHKEMQYSGTDGYNGYIGDAEQAHPAIYAATGGYLDLYTMAGQGTGRRHAQVINRVDEGPAGPGPLTKEQYEKNVRAYEKLVQAAVDGTNAGHFEVVFDAVAPRHMISDWALANVIVPTLARSPGTDASEADDAGQDASQWRDSAVDTGGTESADLDAGMGPSPGDPSTGGGSHRAAGGCALARAPDTSAPRSLGLLVLAVVIRRLRARRSRDGITSCPRTGGAVMKYGKNGLGATLLAGLLLLAGTPGCTGAIVDEDDEKIPSSSGPAHQEPGPGGAAAAPNGLPGPILAAASRLRRLSLDEYNRTLFDLLGDKANAGQILAAEPRTPFDNDYTAQVMSSAFITGSELLAGDVSNRLMKDPARRDKVVGCKPKGVTDADCLEKFITTFGRRVWRRSLTKEDIAGLMKLQALGQQDNDFYSAVDGVLRALLQDPEFLFRVEIGTPVSGSPGLFKLTGPELATRLAYFLWGSTPDDALVTLGEAGGLDTGEKVRSTATGMLADAAARDRIKRFHALWLGYEQLPRSALGLAMKAESDALTARVIFEKQQAWQDLFRSDQTFVTYDLAKHYGITGMLPSMLKAGSSAAAWIPYTGTMRKGILSHGTFLTSTQASDELQLTIRRGKSIRDRLFCQGLPPKPANVAANTAMAKTPCKADVLAARTAGGTCQGCHALLNPVGQGLDNYDDMGAYRTEQYWKFTNDPSVAAPVDKGAAGAVRCPIIGEGDLDGKKFSGPAALADLVTGSEALNTCAVKQIYRFAMGSGQLDDTDQAFVDLMVKHIGSGDFHFDQVLLDFVSSDAFAHRREGK